MSERVFRTRYFSRWMKRVELSDDALNQAVQEMARGLIDADLGGGIIKKRIALPGQGKRGGARTIVATRKSGRWFFLLGFSKNEQANVTPDELKALQELAKGYLESKERDLDYAVRQGMLIEVNYDYD